MSDVFLLFKKLCNKKGERIIVPLERPSGQLNFTSPGHYRLTVFVYTGLFYTGRGWMKQGSRSINTCRRHQGRRGLLLRPLLHQHPRLHRHTCRGRRRLLPRLHRHPRGRRAIASLEVRLYAPLNSFTFLYLEEEKTKKIFSIFSRLSFSSEFVPKEQIFFFRKIK